MVVGILLACVSWAAAAEETGPALSAALQRIYSAGVPVSVDDLHKIDAP